ncbi:MAG: hypothetical protein A3H98_10945 [Bacteroidetes bacterium RIFCSPLOWO2_02_FULL_36_8]|nr:MAG: hypothetical protein A3H98_10945 [Bacteroidetes bacterium RIFCSPLOWO2_02_FULL_36_8]OFY71254.1 MAG: hypothetical protein A3G23_01915 [Bacteroidetes bacterium RIFCSPLOWO2_12_FULL_37_12]
MTLTTCKKKDDDTVTPASKCSDGIQNQGETGVDCGGPCSPCFIPQNIWTQKATNGVAKTFVLGFVIGSKIYIGGGCTESGSSTSKFEEYDPSTDKWTTKVAMPENRYSGFAFTIGTKGYVTAGDNYGGSPIRSTYEYDPATDIWTRKADFPPITKTSRVFGFSIASLNKAYAQRGTEFYEYNPATDKWTQKANLSNPKYGTGFSIGSKGYIGNSSGLNEYDPTSDTWTPKANNSAATPLYYYNTGIGFSIGNKAYLGTGNGATEMIAEFWEWDQASDIWTRKADFMGGPTGQAIGLGTGLKGYVGFGAANGTKQNTWYEFK